MFPEAVRDGYRIGIIAGTNKGLSRENANPISLTQAPLFYTAGRYVETRLWTSKRKNVATDWSH